MATVTTTGFGSAAVETLGRILADRRGADPLAPALVVCSGALVAVGVRRALGRRAGGVANIAVVTLDQLAAGTYEFRVRTVDKHDFAQPEPRPYPKSGRNDVQMKTITVA